MIVKLDLYRVFLEVAKNLNFSKAARELYMTQPAVSQSIRQLERELEIRLFTRTSKGVTLTNEGQQLLEYISTAINLIDVGEKKLIDAKKLLAGELKIGVGDTISRYYLLPYLEKFNNQSPNIKLRIINRTTVELCTMLKSGEIDIAFCNLPIKDAALEVRKCLDVQDIFVYGEKYKKDFQIPVELPALAKYPLILLELKSNSRRYVEKFFLSKGIKINPEIELGSHDLLLDFAEANLGVACVIQEFSQEYLKSHRLFKVPTVEEIPTRSVGFCFLRGVSLSPASSKFLDIVQAN